MYECIYKEGLVTHLKMRYMILSTKRILSYGKSAVDISGKFYSTTVPNAISPEAVVIPIGLISSFIDEDTLLKI